VEAFDVGVLPRAARLDVERPYARGGQPRPHGVCDELRPVVASDELRLTMHAKQVIQHGDDVGGRDAPLHLERVALSRVLIDDGEELEPPAIGRLVHGEVVAPDVVLVLGPHALRAVFAAPQPAPLSLAPYDLEAVLSPEPLHALPVHPPALAA